MQSSRCNIIILWFLLHTSVLLYNFFIQSWKNDSKFKTLCIVLWNSWLVHFTIFFSFMSPVENTIRCWSVVRVNCYNLQRVRRDLTWNKLKINSLQGNYLQKTYYIHSNILYIYMKLNTILEWLWMSVSVINKRNILT